MTNGNYENGLSGWSVASGSAGAATVIVPDAQSYPLMPDGTHAVEVSTTANGSTTLTQTVGTVSAGSTYVLELYEIVGPSTNYLQYQVQLMAGNTVLATTANDSQGETGADGDWMGVELSAIVSTTSSFAGQPLTIQLTAIGQGNAGSMLFDDVKLSQWITSPQAGVTPTLTMPQFGFQGMRWDSAVGLYDDNARYYDPTTGRFLSNDPAGQGTNLYEFDGNDPADNTDPTGLFFTAGSGTFAGGLAGSGPISLTSPVEDVMPIFGNGYINTAAPVSQVQPSTPASDFDAYMTQLHLDVEQAQLAQTSQQAVDEQAYNAVVQSENANDAQQQANINAENDDINYRVANPTPLWAQDGAEAIPLVAYAFGPEVGIPVNAIGAAYTRGLNGQSVATSVIGGIGDVTGGTNIYNGIASGDVGEIIYGAATFELAASPAGEALEEGVGIVRGAAGAGVYAGPLAELGEGLQYNALQLRAAESEAAESEILTADQLRNTPGIVTASEPLSPASGNWLNASIPAAIPSQVADQLVGSQFNSFGDLRSAIWEIIGSNEELNGTFSEANQGNISEGYAPFAPTEFQINGSDAGMRLNLHHIEPIELGGSVYDLSNLQIVSPKVHFETHNPG